VYYLHGALHLIVQGSGVTRKLVHDSRSILDQFGRPTAADPEATPLIITEASAREKMAAIERNDYLAHCYDSLSESADPLVVFGHSLSDQDRHLVDAINRAPERPVAISMRARGGGELKEEQARIFGQLRTPEIYFFDASTHPLGSSDLTLKGKRSRFLGRWFRNPVVDPA
jgi:hypothetical protein